MKQTHNMEPLSPHVEDSTLSDLQDDFEFFCSISRHGSLRERSQSDARQRKRQGSYGEDKLRIRNNRRGSADKYINRMCNVTRLEPEGVESRSQSASRENVNDGSRSPRRPTYFHGELTPRRYPRSDRLLSHMAHGDEDWDMGAMRPRVSSMPVRSLIRRPMTSRAPSLVRLRASHSPDLHRVRAFTITSRGVISNGDKYISNGSVASTESEALSNTSDGSHDTPTPSFIVVIMGYSRVGKRSLIHKFLSAESSTAMSSLDDEAQKTVSILLDGEESIMEFIDVSDQEVEGYLSSNQADAYVVVYSVEDRISYERAIDRLYEIRKDDQRTIAVILVANKTDLVRSRVVQEEEGRSAAKTYDCKYIEVSAAIEHKVNDLLVGILKQIRLIKAKNEKASARYGRHRTKFDLDSCCLIKARQNVLGKLLRTKFSSKSCDNLYVL